MNIVLLFSLFSLHKCASAWTFSSRLPRAKFSLRSTPQDGNDLMEQASRLRKEAEELESTLDPTRQQPEINKEVIEYTSLDDSIWTFTYRCSETPISDEDDAPRPEIFSGKFTVKLLADGYTELISQESATGTPLSIVKAWGWDLETSSEDELEYLLLSVDARLSSEDKRFYLQARQERQAGKIALCEGTVTVKMDVVPSSNNGFFGFLSPKGILAQFRQVGNFAAKPDSAPQ